MYIAIIWDTASSNEAYCKQLFLHGKLFKHVVAELHLDSSGSKSALSFSWLLFLNFLLISNITVLSESPFSLSKLPSLCLHLISFARQQNIIKWGCFCLTCHDAFMLLVLFFTRACILQETAFSISFTQYIGYVFTCIIRFHINANALYSTFSPSDMNQFIAEQPCVVKEALTYMAWNIFHGKIIFNALLPIVL